jgi:hypothetical protein
LANSPRLRWQRILTVSDGQNGLGVFEKKESVMRKNITQMARIVVLVGITLMAQPVRGGDKKSFKGTIADSQCALNVHSVTKSHKELMEAKPEIKSREDCVRYCVKERKGRYVLLAGNKVYKLDVQTDVEQWAGMKVKVFGTLDPDTGVITVRKIEALSVDWDSSSAY